MIRCLCIDGYKTIEQPFILDKEIGNCYEKIAIEIGCLPEDIFNLSSLFTKEYGDFCWEYHEIFWRTLVHQAHNKFDDNLTAQVYSIFLDYYENKVQLYDNTLDALALLSKEAKLILVANGNSKRLQRLIRKFELERFFSDFVISSETPYQKPDRFMFEYALKMYGFHPQEVLMVGDKYDNDVLGAKRCGLHTALMLNSGHPPKSHNLIPDFSISSLAEIIDIIKLSRTKNFIGVSPVEYRERKLSDRICAFIVAGGRGSRLGEMGTTTQKCMLELWGKPILYYTIMSLKNAGCSRIVIAVNHLADQVIDYFGNGNKFGVDIVYVKEAFHSTYHAFRTSLRFFSERILYIHANILFQNILLHNIIEEGEHKNKNIITVVPNQEIHIKHAQVMLDSHEEISECDLSERNNKYPFTFLGVAYYKKKSFLDCFDGDDTGMVEKIIPQLLDRDESVGAYVYNGGWRHIETEADYLELKKQSKWDIYYED